MTLGEAVARFDELKPNTFSYAVKTAWLAEVEGMLYDEILLTHEGVGETFPGFDEETPADTPLAAGAPYDSLYLWYLALSADRANNDTQRYSNSAASFAAAYQSYAAWYNRTHAPLDRCQRFKFIRR